MISIIAPIYNVEKYLEECLLSIQNQTYRDFECIMVNDGSPDNSKEIAEKFLIDSRFKLINQENKGISAARNTAIKEAKGEYITFVDSDDAIKEDMLEKLLLFMDEDVDIVESKFERDFETFNDSLSENIKILFKGYDRNEILRELSLGSSLSHEACGKLYKKECFNNVLFPEGLQYEDLYAYLALIQENKSIMKIDYTGYYYRVNQNSIMNSKPSEKNLDILKICDLVDGLYKEDQESIPFVHRFLFVILLHHYIHIIEDNSTYNDLYQKSLEKYSKKALKGNRALSIFKLFPKSFKRIMLLNIRIKRKLKL